MIFFFIIFLCSSPSFLNDELYNYHKFFRGLFSTHCLLILLYVSENYQFQLTTHHDWCLLIFYGYTWWCFVIRHCSDCYLKNDRQSFNRLRWFFFFIFFCNLSYSSSLHLSLSLFLIPCIIYIHSFK